MISNVLNTIMITRPYMCFRYFLRAQTSNFPFSSLAVPPVLAKDDILKAEDSEKTKRPPEAKRSNSMVVAAFQSLKEPDHAEIIKKFASIDDQIDAARTVHDLLIVADGRIDNKHALRIVSTLADWASDNKANITDFEFDPRFKKLCRMLGRKTKSSDPKVENTNSEDLATVLEVTGDDEAAKLVSTIAFPQMIKVMNTLAVRKRRSTPLMRSLAYHMCREQQQLNVKQSADLLYSMAVLNFPDENLLDKVRTDLSETLSSNDKPAPVGSILVSMGLLRFKDAAVLEMISGWVKDHLPDCRPQDLISLLLTLAHLGYVPAEADELIEKVCSRLSGPQEVPTLLSWLEVVWSLAVLGKATANHAASVLEPKFRAALESTQSLTIAAKLKLLNINAVAKLEIPGYKGPLLDGCDMTAPMKRSQNKEILVKSVLETLTNLLPSATYLRPSMDSGMGFLIDGECLLDAKGNPLPVEEAKDSSETKTARRAKGSRIAILVWDYSDLCRGITDPSGPNALAARLLQQQGMQVCAVPYTEFNPREKLVQRVQFLEHKLKQLAAAKKPAR